MATPRFVNRARMFTSTTGTGSSLTLTAAVLRYFTFSEAGLQDGDVVDYVIEDGNDFEIQIGQTYNSSGPSLSRGTPAASKVGGVAGTSQISLSGNAQVFITAVAESFDISRYTEQTIITEDDLLLGHSDADGEMRKFPIGGVLSAMGRTRRVGEFFWFFGEDPPPYALVCDGSHISRTTYADLWAFAQTSGNLAASEGVKQAGQFGPGNGSTTFTLPDLTTGAEFIRAVTIGRGIGTWQNGALQSHTHTLPEKVMLAQQSSSSLNSGVASGEAYTRVGLVHDSTPGAPNVGSTGGTETRPRNIALLPCIVF